MVLDKALEIAGQVNPMIHPEYFVRYEKNSPLGIHTEWGIRYQGTEIYNAYIKTLVAGNQLRQVTFQTAALAAPDPGTFTPGNAGDHFFSQYTVKSSVQKWVYDGTALVAAYETDCYDPVAHTPYRLLTSAAGTLLYQHPLMDYHHAPVAGPDSLVQGYVFNPDPLTSAEQPYGGAYSDNNDQDSPELTAERYLKPFYARFENDTFILKDSVIYFSELEFPQTDEPRPTQPLFDFTRSQSSFEFVNVFYHIQHFRTSIVNERCGFNLPGNVIQVDPHGSNGQDVSGFSTFYTPPALIFGDGGIDDGEDADVIVHEFGHGLSNGAAPNTNGGTERKSIEEGNSDYFAMTYSKSINPFNWQKTFNWDGNVTWQGRVANSPKRYPEDANNDYYNNAEIWVATLSELWERIGPKKTDCLVLGSLYLLSNNISFQQMGQNILLVDSLQNGAANADNIYRSFRNRGIFSPNSVKETTHPSFSVYNTYGFGFSNESLTIAFAQPFDGIITVYDATGKMHFSAPAAATSLFELSPASLAPGVYFVHVSGSGIRHNFKVIKS